MLANIDDVRKPIDAEEEQTFAVQFGESHAERMMRSFSMVHDETAFRVIRDVGPGGFTLYFELISYTRGRNGVTVFPSNATLAKQAGVSIRTIQRWKDKLASAGVIRVARCYRPDGSDTSNVIILNPVYPDVPAGWSSYAPNGFVRYPGQTPVPIERQMQESVESQALVPPPPAKGPKKPANPPMTNLSRAKTEPPRGGGDKTVMGGATKLSSPQEPARPVLARPQGAFWGQELEVVEQNKEEEEEALRASHNYPDPRRTPEWIADIEQALGRPIRPDEDRLLRDLRDAGVPEHRIVQGVRESVERFVPRYDGDRVKSLRYCVDRIKELDAAAKVPPTHLLFQAPSETRTSLQKPVGASARGKVGWTRGSGEKNAPRGRQVPQTTFRCTPAAQPGKYDAFYRAMEERVTRRVE